LAFSLRAPSFFDPGVYGFNFSKSSFSKPFFFTRVFIALAKMSQAYLTSAYIARVFIILIVLGLLIDPLGLNVSQAAESLTLPGPVRRDLIALAKEPLAAAVANRPVRTPTSRPALSVALPLVVSLYLNGQLTSRTWILESPSPIEQSALVLGAKVLVDPDLGRILTPEELPFATLGVAVLSDLKKVNDDRDIAPNGAAIVFNGLGQSVGLPSDAPPPKTAKDLLDLTCALAGWRPGAWLTGQSVILTGQVAEVLEK
jgi:hypothetical protein